MGPRTRTHRHVLENELRVLVVDAPGMIGSCVSTHYGVGFRAERRGEAGLAHLFEHLMTQDSPAALPSAKLTAALGLGGTAGATTHPDYTEFHQSVPSHALDAVLHWEADRMRAPRFTREHLRAQLKGVAAEVSTRRDRRPFGRLPWPALPEVLYSSFANAHDGYGDLEQLVGTSYEQCLEFYADHYTPSNAVLTVLTDVQEHSGLLQRIERRFADIPDRPHRRPPDLAEEPLKENRVAEIEVMGEEEGPLVLGYRLPDPRSERRSYLAHMVVAQLLCASNVGWARGSVASAGCGLFGPLDAWDPDTMVLVGRPGDRELVEAVDSGLSALAGGELADADLSTAARQVAFNLERSHRRPLNFCDAVGRSELLFSDPDSVPGAVSALRDITPVEVASAAECLHEASLAILVPRPGAGRAGSPPEPRSSGTHTRLDAEPEPYVPLPSKASVREVPRTLMEYAPEQGPQVIVARHRSAGPAEVRLRIDVPDPSRQILSELASKLRTPLIVAGISCVHRVAVRATAVEVSATVPSGAVQDWAARVGDFIRDIELRFEASPCAGSLSASERRSIDPALDHYLGTLEQWDTTERALSSALVVVGDLVPDEVVVPLGECLPGKRRKPMTSEPVSGSVLSQGAEGRYGALRLWSPLSEETVGDPALHMVVAMVNGGASFLAGEPRGLPVGPVPLAGRNDPTGVSLAGAFTGVESVGARSSLFLEARFPANQGPAAIEHVETELAPGRAAAIRQEDVEAVRTLIAGQWELAHDDPVSLADLLFFAVAGGIPVEVVTAPGRMREMDSERFRKLWESIWKVESFSGGLLAEIPSRTTGDLISRVVEQGRGAG